MGGYIGENLRVVRNLLSDQISDYSIGGSFSLCRFSAGALEMIPNGDWAFVSANVSVPSGHKVYVRANCRRDTSPDVAVDMHLELIASRSQGITILYGPYYTGSGEAQVVSASAEQMAGFESLEVVMAPAWKSNGEPVDIYNYFSYPMLIDLTAAFGAGNEPSVEWCDANIPDFFGTATIHCPDSVALRIRKIYIGSDGGAVTSYKYLRWTITGRSGTGDAILQASEFRLIDSSGSAYLWPAGTSIDANLSAAAQGEDVSKLIDNDVATKYCTNEWGSSTFGNCVVTIHSDAGIDLATYNRYQYYTANDKPNRDPVSWKLEASTDMAYWVTLDTRDNISITTDRKALAGTWPIQTGHPLNTASPVYKAYMGDANGVARLAYAAASYTVTSTGYGFSVAIQPPNPNPYDLDGVYRSNNYHIASSNAVARIEFDGYDVFTVYIRSYAENNYDYIMASTLDAASAPTQYTDGTVKAHTRGNQQWGTTIGSYTKVQYPTDGGMHHIYIAYRKDSSSDQYDDRGYFLIER